MEIPDIAAPYKINFKEILLQAAAVVAVIQDKLRGDKNKFESYPLVWSVLKFLFLSEDIVIVLTTYLHRKWHTCDEKRRLFCRLALRT
jgi:hypothetical protein